MVVLGVTDDGEVDLHTMEKGAVYVLSAAPHDDGRPRFEFVGHHSNEEVHRMIRGGYVGGGDIDDCDPADDWNK